MVTSVKRFKTIVSGFTKTLNELNNLIKDNDLKIDKNEAKILKISEVSNGLEDERALAETFKSNLEELLGITVDGTKGVL